MTHPKQKGQLRLNCFVRNAFAITGNGFGYIFINGVFVSNDGNTPSAERRVKLEKQNY